MVDIAQELKGSKVVASFFIGSLDYLLQRWQGRLRYLKHTDYKDHKFVIMMDSKYHVFVQDFVDFTINLPIEFRDFNLVPENYEAVLNGSESGSFTPPEVYSELIKYIRSVYDLELTKEIWCPRGDTKIMYTSPQTFCRFSGEPIESELPTIVIFPNANNRRVNIPEYVWGEIVQRLQSSFTVVLAGDKKESYLQNAIGKNIINLISDDTEEKIEQTIIYLSSSVCSISSQCSGSHISLFSGCPSYIIGDEKNRFINIDNRIQTPVSFHFTDDLRLVNVDSVLAGVSGFLNALDKQGFAIGPKETPGHDDVLKEDINILNEIIKGRHE